MQQLAKIATKYNEIWVDQEGILVLRMQEGAEMDLEEVVACFEAYAQLGFGKGKKVLQLIVSKDNATMSHDARQYVSEKGSDFFIASAIVGQALAVRLIVNFFNTFYKHNVPFRMFSNENHARVWLRSQHKD